MSNQIGPTVKHVWIIAMNVLHNLGGGFVINTTVYHLGRYSLRLLLLMISMNLPSDVACALVLSAIQPPQENDTYIFDKCDNY